jgi:uncharacterized protein YbcC (UPF0753/DUF2309 family)
LKIFLLLKDLRWYRKKIGVHDPVRLLVIAEHFPEIVKYAISKNPATYEWFKNDWVKLIVVHPETKEIFAFTNEEFVTYNTVIKEANYVYNNLELFENTINNLPVGILKNA